MATDSFPEDDVLTDNAELLADGTTFPALSKLHNLFAGSTQPVIRLHNHH